MRSFRKYLALLLALLIASICLFTACDGGEGAGNTDGSTDDGTTAENTEDVTGDTEDVTDDVTDDETTEGDGKVSYTVKVVDANGAPIKGASVRLCDSVGCRFPSATDENGVCVFEYEPSDFHATVIGAPAGYAYDAEQSFDFDPETNSVTITLAASN